MLNKVLGSLLLFYSFLTFANANIDTFIENFDYLSLEEKLALKKELSVDEWIDISSDKNIKFQLNFKYIKTSPNNLVEAWVKGIAMTDTKQIKKDNYYRLLYQYNCDDLTYKLLEGHIYDRLTGESINSSVYSSSSQISERIIPDTTGSSLFQVACFFNKVKSVNNLKKDIPKGPYKNDLTEFL